MSQTEFIGYIKNKNGDVVGAEFELKQTESLGNVGMRRIAESDAWITSESSNKRSLISFDSTKKECFEGFEVNFADVNKHLKINK